MSADRMAGFRPLLIAAVSIVALGAAVLTLQSGTMAQDTEVKYN